MKTPLRIRLAALTLPLALGFAACAHHRDVRPGADGIHRVVVRASERESAERSAISQAEDFCDERHLAPAFVNEQTQYTGKMDEGTRDTLHKASTAAMILGGGVGIGTYGAARTAGGAVGTAGAAGAIMTGGKDYTADMRFKCQ
jgi:hypothetical protein